MHSNAITWSSFMASTRHTSPNQLPLRPRHFSFTQPLTHSFARSLTRWVLPLRPQPCQRQRRPLRMVTALSLHAYRSHHAHWSSCMAGCGGAWSNALLNSAFTPHQASETSATDSDGVSSKRSRPDAKVSGNGVLVHVYACMHNQA